MPPLSRRLLSSVVEVYPHERATVFLMFAYSFLAMTSYNIIKPATRSTFIVDLGAENLPFVMLAAGLLMGGVMHLYSRLVTLLPARSVIPVTQGAIIAVSVVLWFLLRTGQAWVSALFFFWGLLLGIFLISQFWTLANDLFDARQGKRLFGFIGGGASLGGITGAATTALTAERFGTENLVLVSVLPLVVCFAVSWYVSLKADPASGPESASDERVRGREALGLLRHSKHLRLIAGVVGFAAMSAVTLDQQLSMAAEELVVAQDAITGFLAQVTVYISLIGFFIQVGLTSRVHRRLGIGFALMVLPVSLGLTGAVMLLYPVLWAPALARVLNSSLRYTLDKTSREILFLPLPPELKHSAKPFVDVAVDRFMGKGLGSVVLLVLLKLFNLTWYQLSYVSLVLMVLWIWLARRARHEYLTVFRRQLHARRLAPDHIDVPQADLATIDLLVEELGRPEEERVLHAIDLLDSLEQTGDVTPLLLRHHLPRVRARALQVLAKRSPDEAGRWDATVEHLLRDDSADVRAAAVEALATARQEGVTDLMRPYLADPDPRVVAAAAVALGTGDAPDDVEMARSALERLAHGDPTLRHAGLKEAARAAALIPGPKSRPYLTRLLRDPDWEVALEAVHHHQAEHDPEHAVVPELVRLLPDRRLRHAARHALARYGEKVVDTLATLLGDQTQERRVRWQLASTLPLLPSQQTVRTLMDALGDPDAVLRYQASLALGKLRREQDGLSFESALVEEAAVETSRRCAERLRQLSLVRQGPGPDGSLLAAALLEEVARTREQLFLLLSLIYPWREIRAARWAIETGDRVHHANAVEYLDNILSGRLRRQTIPLLDRRPPGDGDQPTGGQRPAVALKDTDADADRLLSSLILDDQPIVAACAIEMVRDERLSHLTDVLEQVRDEPTRDPLVVASAARVLAALRPPSHGSVPVLAPSALDIVRRLSAAPVLEFVPVRELFHLAEQVEHVRYRHGQTIFDAGERADRIQLLLDGELVVRDGSVETARLGPGAIVGLEEVLSGLPMQRTARAEAAAVCLSRRADTFLALLSDHAAVLEGLFRHYLRLGSFAEKPMLRRAMAWPTPASGAGQPLSQAQKALLLELTSLWSTATGEALLSAAAIAHETPFDEGATLVGEADPPAIYIVLSGELSVESPGRSATLTAGRGDELGVVATLTGRPMGLTARALSAGVALIVQREDLFEFLGDHIGPLRAVFRAVLAAPPSAS